MPERDETDAETPNPLHTAREPDLREQLAGLWQEAVGEALANEQISTAREGIDGTDDVFLRGKLDQRAGKIWEQVTAERRAYESAHARFSRVAAEVRRDAELPALRLVSNVAGISLGVVLAALVVEGVVALVAGRQWFLLAAGEALGQWAGIFLFGWFGTALANTLVLRRRLRYRAIAGALAPTVTELSTASDTLRNALYESSVQTLAEILNDEIRAGTSTALSVRGIPGLGELSDPSYDVETDAVERLGLLVKHLEGGTIGIAGPRGVGKTTLIRGFYEGRWGSRGDRLRVGVVVSAPVQYEPRDFVLHLFDALCQELLGLGRVERSRTEAFMDLERRRREELGGLLITMGTLLFAGGCGVLAFQWLEPKIGASVAAAIPLLVAGAIGLAGGVALRFFAPPSDDDPTRTSVTPELIAALLPLPGFASRSFTVVYRVVSKVLWPWATTSGAVAASIRLLSRLGLVETAPPPDPGGRDAVLERMAREELTAIKFQQTYTSGWSGSLKVAAAATVGADAKLSLARTQMSLPEVVERFRRFVRDVAMDRDVVIGIDELDKMDSALIARRFLNDIKSVFGITGCFYLVSVSEDAMSAFERRGLPLRDVFDSSLDDIVRVSHLTLDEAELVLRRRVIGLPYPFLCLCHCFSAGLPRDLVRAARLLLPAGVPASQERMEAAVQRLVKAELAGKLEAATIAARDCGDPGAWLLLRWLRLVGQTSLVGSELIARCTDEAITKLVQRPVRDLNGGDSDIDRSVTLPDLAGEMAAYLYYAATLLDYFTDEMDLSWMKNDELPKQVSPEELANARRQLGTSWILAWDGVSAFRTSASLGSALEPPLPSSLADVPQEGESPDAVLTFKTPTAD